MVWVGEEQGHGVWAGEENSHDMGWGGVWT